MAENTKIEWAHHTFNGWIGCTKVGPGCDNCYAADLSKARLGVPWGPGEPRRHTAASTWKQPRRWNSKAAKLGIRYRVFCASLADVFDNEVPAEWRADLFQLIRETPHLDWLLVTKRIGNAPKMAEAAGGFPSNVWLGATIVNQAEADRDIPKLLAVQGPRFRFLSMEPLLGPVSLEEAWHGESALSSECWGQCGWCKAGHPPLYNCQRGRQEGGHWFDHPTGRSGLDWIIVGGESGPKARPMHPDWARSLRDQCEAAGVPFLFKQWGEYAASDLCSLNCTGNRAQVFDNTAAIWRAAPADGGWIGDQAMCRVGKKTAGRLLDGVQHDGVPTVEKGRGKD